MDDHPLLNFELVLFLTFTPVIENIAILDLRI